MAFLHSGPRREPALKAPSSVLILIGVIVAAHLGRILLPAGDSLINEYAFIPLRYSPHALAPGSVLARAVPFFSYMFIHADWTHLAINCLWLLAFGAVVARRFGGALFVLFFLVCGVGAAVIHLALNWESPAAVIGASGAISGLMGAGIRMLHIPRMAEAALAGRLAPIFSSQVIAFSGLWIAINLIFGLTGLSIAGESHLIAWEAHLGGYFVGLALSGPFNSLARRGRTDMDAGAGA
ncbi:MAG TPA: rhomboid family intramembrane serine protease [Rhizomicrobium sp.]|nr:rhomboid family intramembrane serine protease [Rhizomicrobium sp.]